MSNERAKLIVTFLSDDLVLSMSLRRGTTSLRVYNRRRIRYEGG